MKMISSWNLKRQALWLVFLKQKHKAQNLIKITVLIMVMFMANLSVSDSLLYIYDVIKTSEKSVRSRTIIIPIL